MRFSRRVADLETKLMPCFNGSCLNHIHHHLLQQQHTQKLTQTEDRGTKPEYWTTAKHLLICLPARRQLFSGDHHFINYDFCWLQTQALHLEDVCKIWSQQLYFIWIKGCCKVFLKLFTYWGKLSNGWQRSQQMNWSYLTVLKLWPKINVENAVLYGYYEIP